MHSSQSLLLIRKESASPSAGASENGVMFELLAVAVAIIITGVIMPVILMAIPVLVVPTVFPTDVMAVNPMMP